MRAFASLAALALMAGCQSKGAAAEERYRIVERNRASHEELCREAGLVAQAYLEDHNEEKYQTWRMTRDNHCVAARLE